MRKIIVDKTVNVKTLSDPERQSFIDDVFGIYSKIFHGWSRDKIQNLINDESCSLFKVRFFLNAADDSGSIVGFAWINARRIEHEGKQYTVFHNVGGLMGNVRKKGLITSFFTKEIVLYKLLHPLQKIFSFQRLIHCAAYSAWVKAIYELYPRYDKETPRKIIGLISLFNQVFQYKPVSEIEPFVVYTDNFVNQSDEEMQRWINKKDPDIEFYNKMTGFRNDYALVMIFSCSFKTIITSLWIKYVKWVAHRFRKK